MRRRQSCSPISAPFRCECRPSRWLLAALTLLGGLAALAALTCDLQAPVAWPLAVLGLAGSWRLVRREWQRPVVQLLIPSGAQPARLDDRSLDRLELLERGPWVLLRWQSDGRRGCLLFGPDNLPQARRRELRLAVRAHAVSRQAGTMAP
ncbi:MAG: hypothetical protein ACN6RG_17900 [Stenotrophomonas sp.]